MPDRIYRVVDNVFQIRGTCSSYVIVDGDAALIIDPGDGDWWDETAQWRTGGFDRVCAGIPESPTTKQIGERGIKGT